MNSKILVRETTKLDRLCIVLDLLITYKMLLALEITFFIINIMHAFIISRVWLMYVIILGIRLQRIILRKLVSIYKKTCITTAEYYFRLASTILTGPLMLVIHIISAYNYVCPHY